MKKCLLVAAAALSMLASACNLCSLAGSCLSCASGLCSVPLLVQQSAPPDEQQPQLVSLPVDEATVTPAAMCF